MDPTRADAEDARAAEAAGAAVDTAKNTEAAEEAVGTAKVGTVAPQQSLCLKCECDLEPLKIGS